MSRESHNWDRLQAPTMDRQQWMALILVLLMVGSSLVYGISFAL